MKKLGIMSAMLEEIEVLLEKIIGLRRTVIGGRSYFEGVLFARHVVIVFSGWGKVAASSAATTLINKFKVDEIVFTGVAGAADSDLRIGDIVVADKLYQHDFDASPFLEKNVLPEILRKDIETNFVISQNLLNSCQKFIDNHPDILFAKSNKVIKGGIATGDVFVKTDQHRNSISQSIENLKAIEMEGGAVAQVCYNYNISFAIFRIISDSANEKSIVDFPKFIDNTASQYTYNILKYYIENSKDS